MLPTTPAIEDMLDKAWKFVEANRRENKPYHGMGEGEVKLRFHKAILQKSFLLCALPDGRIIGVVDGVPDIKHKLFHVCNILTIHNLAIRVFVSHFDSLWPGFKLAGYRFGNLVNYNTPKLKRRLRKDYV